MKLHKLHCRMGCESYAETLNIEHRTSNSEVLIRTVDERRRSRLNGLNKLNELNGERQHGWDFQQEQTERDREGNF